VYWADGVIVATATGSTAYGFSVGGPLILPSSRAIMLVPIAPHLSFGNAVVFDPDQRIELDVRDGARISIDGQEEHDLGAGDRIAVRRSETVAKFARTSHARPFLSLLREKILKEPGT
ncbi:MAG: NAD(+)/NADH kinase, partial [Chloroflexi bacterium]